LAAWRTIDHRNDSEPVPLPGDASGAVSNGVPYTTDRFCRNRGGIRLHPPGHYTI